MVYEEVVVTLDKSDDSASSDEEVEYIYEIEYIEEEEEEKQKDEPKMDTKETSQIKPITVEFRKNLRSKDPQPSSILLDGPPSFRKSVSFSSVHSVLTENNDIIFVDDTDDIFS